MPQGKCVRPAIEAAGHGRRTARAMIDAVTYLTQLASRSGLTSVAAKLGAARGELIVAATIGSQRQTADKVAAPAASENSSTELATTLDSNPVMLPPQQGDVT